MKFKGKKASVIKKNNLRALFPLGKKGMMDDLFDFLFTVIAAFFILFFISMVLSGGVAKANEQSLVKVGVLNDKDNFLLLLKTPVNERETLLDLVGTVSGEERSKEFNKVVGRVMYNFYPSKADWWWVRIYEEDEKPTELKETFGRYKDYAAGGEGCGPYKNSITEEVLVPQADGTKSKLVYCVSTWEYRTSFD